jgi:hypothetical protein
MRRASTHNRGRRSRVFGRASGFLLAQLPSEACSRSVQAAPPARPGCLLTVCSPTVRIHPDVPAPLPGKNHAGQACNDGHSWTWRDGLVGFNSRHADPPRAASANPGSDSICCCRRRRSTDRLIAPGVVDHIPPGAVGLTPRHLGRGGAQDHPVAVRSGAAQRPGVGQIGQVADGDHQLGLQPDPALEGQEALQGSSHLLTAVATLPGWAISAASDSYSSMRPSRSPALKVSSNDRWICSGVVAGMTLLSSTTERGVAPSACMQACRPPRLGPCGLHHPGYARPPARTIVPACNRVVGLHVSADQVRRRSR